MTFFKERPGFTLIELLVVIGILVILGVVVVLILNPAQIFKESRDAKRTNDLTSLNNAIRVAASLNLDENVATDIVYISLPDDDADCSSYALPDIDPLVYQCVPEEDLRNIDGTGWVPIDFTQLSIAGVNLPTIPVDPVNTESGLYYTYQKGSWLLSALMESEKFQNEVECVFVQSNGDPDLTAPDHGQDDGCGVVQEGGGGEEEEEGGLIAYWAFDGDYLDSENDFDFAVGGGSPSFVAGEVNQGVDFDGDGDYISAGSTGDLGSLTDVTITAWVKLSQDVPNEIVNEDYMAIISLGGTGLQTARDGIFGSNNILTWHVPGAVQVYASSVDIVEDEWHFIAITQDGSTVDTTNSKIYFDGDLQATAISGGGSVSYGGNTRIAIQAGVQDFGGVVDEVRIYDSVLSAEEIQDLYDNP